MRILQINANYPNGSTGTNTRELHQFFLSRGAESFVASAAFESGFDPASCYAIGTNIDHKLHALHSRVTGLQAYGSYWATRRLCRYIDKIAPDIIHLQNVHSHCLNLPYLLRFIARRNGALSLSLHDCWFFTGRCVHYTRCGCEKFLTGCGNCPKGYYGIKTWGPDRSAKMANDRRKLFAQIKRLGVIGVSDWVLNEAKRSFIFKDHPSVRWTRIYNWVDDTIFKPRDPEPIRKRLGLKPSDKMILGVSAYWSKGKGLPLFTDLAAKMPAHVKVVLIGKPPAVQNSRIIFPGSVNDPEELACWYSAADLFVQGSKEETFGKVTAESFLCGTPAAVFGMTGNLELISAERGAVISDENLFQPIFTLLSNPKSRYSEPCRQFAQTEFNPLKNKTAYLEFFRTLMN